MDQETQRYWQMNNFGPNPSFPHHSKFGLKITPQRLGPQDTCTGAEIHHSWNEKLVFMNFSRGRHDSFGCRHVEQICWQKDRKLLTTACYKMIIKRIQTGFFEGRLDISNRLQCLWIFLFLIFVDATVGERYGWSHSSDSCFRELPASRYPECSSLCQRAATVGEQ